ncbi:MAG: hypothetical protein IKO41_15855 [Lachnospiraceae bacterium]|nr:hypothetical protein [Lachnospiraceae bacterium]
MNGKKLTIGILLCAIFVSSKTYAGGIPVFDGVANTNAIAQIGKMVEEITHLQTQIDNQVKQIENMMLNNIAPATYIWQEADANIKKLLQLQNQLSSSNLESYLDKYKSLDFYRNNPYNSQYENQMKQTQEAQTNLAQTISQQQDMLRGETQKLQTLQNNAQSARGRLEALQYANQLAAAQNNQLMQMRTLMMQQAAAQNAEAQQRADERARSKAIIEKIRKDSSVYNP